MSAVMAMEGFNGYAYTSVRSHAVALPAVFVFGFLCLILILQSVEVGSGGKSDRALGAHKKRYLPWYDIFHTPVIARFLE